MTQLSPNFTLEELTFSETALRQGLPNTPDNDQVDNLRRLCAVLLEPARQILGVPLHVNSGYRSMEVNIRVGGARTSAHLDGRAADLLPVGMNLGEAFDKLKASGLPFDQIIFECGAWIHLAIPRFGEEPRIEALTASGGPGRWVYQQVHV